MVLQEEIGEVFDRWKSPVIQSAGIPPLPPPRSNKKPAGQNSLQNGKKPYQKSYQQLIRTNSLPSPKRRNGDLDKTLNAWSEGLLAEFNTIIANELTSLLAAEPADDEIFVSSDDESNMIRYRVSRSKSVGDQDPPPSPATSPSTSDTSSGSTGSGRPHRPISRVLRRQPRTLTARDKSTPVLLRVKALPEPDLLPSSIPGVQTLDEGISSSNNEDSPEKQLLQMFPTRRSYSYYWCSLQRDHTAPIDVPYTDIVQLLQMFPTRRSYSYYWWSLKEIIQLLLMFPTRISYSYYRCSLQGDRTATTGVPYKEIIQLLLMFPTRISYSYY
ncbi:hypothetical protein J6590_003415 [Homalodisca vitripennis]|nr:hypothetical protein J6590_003415 [Homalodisca vitripennis]